MQQVLDFFDLVADRTNQNVVWNLTFASTNSPFVAEAEPVDLRTNASAFSTVEKHVRIIERGLARIAAGDPVDHDFPKDKLTIVERIFERNINGIGRTTLGFGNDEDMIEIESVIVPRSLQTIRGETDALYEYLFNTFARIEVGSIDGRIIDLGTHYDKPAIQVTEHNSNQDVWCQIDENALREIEGRITAGDVWQHRRVRIRGKINYDASGKITRAFDGQISYFQEKDVSIEDLHDPDFTGEMKPYEYLEGLRENDFE